MWFIVHWKKYAEELLFFLFKGDLMVFSCYGLNGGKMKQNENDNYVRSSENL